MGKDSDRIKKLKIALLEFLGVNGRYYGELTRLEQSVEDLAQALNTRLDQLALANDQGCQVVVTPESPREKLANRLLATATSLTQGGQVDGEMADDFERALEAFDLAADLKRQAKTAIDSGETAAIKHKRGRS